MPAPYTLSRRRLLGLFGGAAAAAAMVGCGAIGAPAGSSKDTTAKDAPAKDAPAKDAHAKDGAGKDGADAHAAPGATAHGATQASFGPTYLIKDRIVNLADGAIRRYLRFSVAIEFASHEPSTASAAPPSGDARSHLIGYTPGYDGYQPVSVDEKNDPEKQFQTHVKRYVPAMEDAVTTLLSSKTYAEVATAERREATKQEIKARLGSLLDGTDLTVTNVYFTDFVVQ